MFDKNLIFNNIYYNNNALERLALSFSRGTIIGCWVDRCLCNGHKIITHVQRSETCRPNKYIKMGAQVTNQQWGCGQTETRPVCNTHLLKSLIGLYMNTTRIHLLVVTSASAQRRLSEQVWPQSRHLSTVNTLSAAQWYSKDTVKIPLRGWVTQPSATLVKHMT